MDFEYPDFLDQYYQDLSGNHTRILGHNTGAGPPFYRLGSADISLKIRTYQPHDISAPRLYSKLLSHRA